MESARIWILVAAALGALGVALGAFGAHALRTRLEPAQIAIWGTAVEYHLIHALALLALALFGVATHRSVQPSAALFTAGVLLFSGSLYGLSLGGPRWLGPVTPIGGLCFLGGWIALAWVARSAS